MSDMRLDEDQVPIDDLAADGADVLPGIDAPSEGELLAYLEECGFGPGDEALLRG